MKQILFALAILSVFCMWTKAECGLSGAWECTGGRGAKPIQGLTFGSDVDDDDFSLFVHTADCTIMQDGDYTVNRKNQITVSLGGFFDNCETSEGSTCTCYNNFRMTVSSDCLDITGPNGEHCQPARGN